MAKVQVLNTTHPSYDGMRLQRLRALLDGGPAFHAIKGKLFPQRDLEHADSYKKRLEQVGYTNHAGTVIGVLGALLFAEPPALSGMGEGATDTYYGRLWKDCDGTGTSWTNFWRDRLRDAQAGQHAWVWVNLPKRDAETAPSNRAEEEAAGLLDAYLVGLTPEQVIDHETDDRGRLQWILFRAFDQRRPSPEDPRETVWRWTYIDAAVIRQWEWEPQEGQTEPLPESEAQELEPISHGFGVLPVVRLSLPTDLWAMGRLEDPAIRATRARNDQSWALHQAASELLVITSAWGDEQVKLGHAAYLKLSRDKSGSDTAQYIGPSGVAFDHLQKDVDATRDEVYRVVQQMALSADADAARQRMSGESKGMDWKATEIVLETLSDLVRDAMLQTVLIIARDVRGDLKGEALNSLAIGGLDSWSEESLLQFLEGAEKATDARELSPTFIRTVARRQAERLLADEVDEETLAVIREEIEQAATTAAANADVESMRALLTEALSILDPSQRLSPAKRTKAHTALTQLARTLQVRAGGNGTDPNDPGNAAGA